MIETAPWQTVRFGAFEVDLRAGELRKGGSKIKLQEKPFQALTLLLEHAGEMVTREHLRQKLWPADTFVDFDHSLGTAIAKLRQALGDSAQNPRFVETVSSRGYRFIASVTRLNQTSDASPSTPIPHEQPCATAPRVSNRVRRLASSVAAGLLGGALLVGIFLGFDVGGAREWLRHRSYHPVHSLAVRPSRTGSGPHLGKYALRPAADLR